MKPATAIAGNFFDALAPLRRSADSFDPRCYGRAPDDWLLAVTDVEGSTIAVEAGRHRVVNMAGAAGIAAVKNACAGETIPFLFSGDGAAVLIPPGRIGAARAALAATCSFAKREYGLALRAGAMSVGEIRQRGRDVLIARYEPSAGNSFGLFLGGGVQLLERAIKGRDPALPATVIEIRAAPDGAAPDLSGLSCRWSPLKSTRGKMAALIIVGAADARTVYDAVMAIADPDGIGVQPVRRENLSARWPPKFLMLEAKARRGKLPVALTALRLLLETLVLCVVFKRGWRLGSFDPTRYIDEMVRNIDFSKYDDSLSMVIDCPEDRIALIRAYLDRLSEQGALNYGIRVSDSAVMTCLVESATEHRHVHFIDGADGGYTLAAKEMKGRLAGRRATDLPA